MRRVGIVGIENSHTDHFVRYLNRDGRHPDARVTAIVRGEPDRTTAVAGDELTVVDSPADLIGQVDAAIVCTRDGALHREHAEPLLRAGIPVLVDKPLATTAADAEALIAAARSAGVVLVSASAVRFVPQVGELVAQTGRTGALQTVSVLGPADPDSPYSGLTFYGIHVVETALELTGDGPFGEVSVHRAGDAIVATTVINEIVTSMTFVVPDDEGRVPFRADVTGRHGHAGADLELGADYNLPLLQRFMAAIDSGRSEIDADALIRPVALLERITAGLG